MLELTSEQMDLVSGADMNDVNIVAGAALAGAAFGGLFAGPVGVVAGGIGGTIDGLLIDAFVHLS